MKQIQNEEVELKELEEGVTFKFKFPAKAGTPKTSSLKMIGVHELGEGAYEVLVIPVKYDAKTRTMTFKLDKFSEYAMFYTLEPAKAKPTPTPSPNKPEEDKSDDTSKTEGSAESSQSTDSTSSAENPVVAQTAQTSAPVTTAYSSIQTGDSPWPLVAMAMFIISSLLALIFSMSKKKHRALSAILAAVSVASLAYIGFTMYKNHESAQTYQNLRSYTTISQAMGDASAAERLPDIGPDPQAAETDPTPTVEWNALETVCPDVVAWITIEGTGIDYPVVQAPEDDPTRYLNRDAMEKRSSSGAIFMLNSDSLDDPNAFLFGHNMRDGSMFGELKKLYKAEDIGHTVTITSPGSGTEEYRMIAMAVVDKYTTLYRVPEADAIFDYVDEVRESAAIFSSYEGGDIITLSTCYGPSGTSKRLLVFCEKVG